jgi:ribosomal subunit interface protein
MGLRVSGKNLDIGEALRAHVQARIDTTFSKYGGGPIVGHVTIEPEGSEFRTDCTLHLNSGATLQADAKAHEPYASFNRAADRIEKRLQRYRRRLSDRHAAGDGRDAGRQGAELEADLSDEDSALADAEDAAANLGAAVIAEPLTSFKEMTVADAVRELDRTQSPFVIFRHALNGRTNVVYRRLDGNIGWVDPC